MNNRSLAFAAGLLLGILALAIHTGCSVDSANGTSRTVGISVGGIYRYDSGACGNDGRFVTANSGRAVISLDLRQAGDSLEAIDNNGIIFRGTIGNVVDNSASFNLEGATTAGNSALISGNIAVSGGKGVMQATWVENTFFATLCGSSTGQSVTTNAPPATNTNDNASITIGFQATEQLAAYRDLAWWLGNG
jgi:hypothetical protein